MDQYNFAARCQFVSDQASMSKLASDLKNTLKSAGADNIKIKFDVDKASASAALGQIRQIKTATDDLTASFSKFGEMTGLAGRRFAAFSTATMGIFALVGAVKAATREAIAFDTALNKLEQVSGQTYRQVSALADETMKLGTSLGVSMKELMNSVVTFKQAGMSLEQVRDAMKAVAATSLAPNFESIKQTTEGAIAVFQQFGKESKKLHDQLGAMNAVAGEFAVEAGDLVTAAQKAGGAFSVLGGSLEELLGLFTSVRSTTRESAESIATGMRTIFSRLQRHDTVEALKDLNVNLRHTREEAEQMGKTEIAGQFVGAYEAVRRLSEGLKGLQTTDTRFTNVIEQLGGQRQISRVIPLLQQFGEAQKAVNVAKVGGVSLQINEEQAHKRIENRLIKVREEYQKLFNEMGQTSQIQKMVDAFEFLAVKIAKVAENLGPLVTTLASFGMAKVAASLPNFARGVIAGPQQGPLAVRKSSGGPIMGSGVGDNVPAVLESGEYVLNKQTARNIGYGRLEQANNRQHYAGGGIVRTLRNMGLGAATGFGAMGGTSMTEDPNMLELADGSLMGAAAGAAATYASPLLVKLKNYLKGKIQFPKRKQFKGIDAEILPDVTPEQQQLNEFTALHRNLYKIGSTNSGMNSAEAAAAALEEMGVGAGASLIKRGGKSGLPAVERTPSPTRRGYDRDTMAWVLRTTDAKNKAKYNQVRLTQEEISRAMEMREEGLDPVAIALELSGEGRITPVHKIKSALKRRGMANGGMIDCYAGGDFVTGGTPGKDSVPAMLMPEEFVIKASSAKKIGAQALRHANQFGELPKGYADGSGSDKLSIQSVLGSKGIVGESLEKFLADIARQATAIFSSKKSIGGQGLFAAHFNDSQGTRFKGSTAYDILNYSGNGKTQTKLAGIAGLEGEAFTKEISKYAVARALAAIKKPVKEGQFDGDVDGSGMNSGNQGKFTASKTANQRMSMGMPQFMAALGAKKNADGQYESPTMNHMELLRTIASTQQNLTATKDNPNGLPISAKNQIPALVDALKALNKSVIDTHFGDVSTSSAAPPSKPPRKPRIASAAEFPEGRGDYNIMPGYNGGNFALPAGFPPYAFSEQKLLTKDVLIQQHQSRLAANNGKFYKGMPALQRQINNFPAEHPSQQMRLEDMIKYAGINQWKASTYTPNPSLTMGSLPKNPYPWQIEEHLTNKFPMLHGGGNDNFGQLINGAKPRNNPLSLSMMMGGLNDLANRPQLGFGNSVNTTPSLPLRPFDPTRTSQGLPKVDYSGEKQIDEALKAFQRRSGINFLDIQKRENIGWDTSGTLAKMAARNGVSGVPVGAYIGSAGNVNDRGRILLNQRIVGGRTRESGNAGIFEEMFHNIDRLTRTKLGTGLSDGSGADILRKMAESNPAYKQLMDKKPEYYGKPSEIFAKLASFAITNPEGGVGKSIKAGITDADAKTLMGMAKMGFSTIRALGGSVDNVMVKNIPRGTTITNGGLPGDDKRTLPTNMSSREVAQLSSLVLGTSGPGMQRSRKEINDIANEALELHGQGKNFIGPIQQHPRANLSNLEKAMDSINQLPASKEVQDLATKHVQGIKNLYKNLEKTTTLATEANFHGVKLGQGPISSRTGGAILYNDKNEMITGGGSQTVEALKGEMKKLRSGIFDQMRSYGASRGEASIAAREMTEHALSNNLSIRRDGNKSYLTNDSLKAIRPDLGMFDDKMLANASKTGQLNYGGGGGWMGRQADKISNWRNNLPDNSFRKALTNPVAISLGLSTAAGYAAQALEPTAQTTRLVGESEGATNNYRRGRIGSAALSYAAVGASVGAGFGGIGAPVGAVVGLGAGLYNGMRDANREIKDLHTSGAVEGIGTDLDFYNKGLRKFGDLNGGEFTARAKTIRDNARSQAYDASNSIWHSTSAEELGKSYKKELRLSAGGQLFPMMNQVNMRAAELGKQAYNIDDSAIKNEDKADYHGKGLMKEGVTAANVSLLVDLGAYKTTNEAVRELGKEFIRAKDAEQKRKKFEESGQQTERLVTSLGRMADMVEKATQSTEGFARHLQLIEHGTATMKDISHVLGNIGMNSEGSLKSASEFFKNSGADQFSDSLSSNEKFAKLLPSALIAVNSGGHKDEDIGKQLQDMLLNGIGKDSLSDVTDKTDKAVLQNIIKEFGEMVHKDRGSVSNAVGGDVTGFSKSLMSKTENPLTKFGIEYYRGIKNIEGTLEQGSSTAAGFRRTAADFRTSAAETSLQSKIMSGRFANGESGALDRISLNRLNKPFDVRMDSFGAAGMNVGQIVAAKKLTDEQKESSLEAKESLRGKKGYFEADQSFQNLVLKSNDLTSALKALAEGTKVATAQMKLASVNSSLDSRRGYAQQFITADWETKAKMTRQQNMVNSLGEKGEGFENFGWEHKGEIVNALASMGDMKLADGTRASQKLKNVTDRILPGGMHGDELNEKKQLEEEAKKAIKEQQAAQEALAKMYEEKNDKFLGGLGKLFDAFLVGLDRSRLTNELQTVTNQQAGLSTQRNKNTLEVGYASMLKDKFGVDSDAKVEAARGQMSKLNELAQMNSEIAKLDDAKSNGKNSSFRFMKDSGFMGNASGFNKEFKPGGGWAGEATMGPERWSKLTTSVLDTFKFDESNPDLGPEVKDNLLARITADKKRYRDSLFKINRDSSSPEEKNQAFLGLTQRYQKDYQLAVKEEQDKKGATRAGLISGLTGYGGWENREKLMGVRQPDVDAVGRAMGAFNSGNTLSGLDKRVADIDKAFDEFGISMTEITKKINALPLPVAKAGGGLIGAARGTDTVPAMLTPGEFIVSADKAAKNKKLLEHINGGGKATYLAGGGFVGLDSLLQETGKEIKLKKSQDKMFGNMMLDKDMALAGWQSADSNKSKEGFTNRLISNEQADFTRRGLAAIAYSGPEMDAGQASVFRDSADERAKAYGASGRSTALSDQHLQNKIDKNEAFEKAAKGREIAKAQAIATRNRNAEPKVQANIAFPYGFIPHDPSTWNNYEGAPTPPGVIKRAAGGPIPGMGYGDKVPVMAEPGEFMINAKAAQRFGQGNLAQINNGGQGGGFGGGSNQLATALMEFNQKVGNISTAFTVFGANVDKLVAVMEKFPQNIEMTGNVTHTHNHNGAEVFGELKKMIEETSREMADKAIDDRVPGANMRSQS